ncbi:MAG: hypothetical protein QN716_08980, partial [Nitrososphaeraceae archaeon]|nr:hypothetical protein [Nitrososphaeraceae archaeon]
MTLFTNKELSIIVLAFYGGHSWSILSVLLCHDPVINHCSVHLDLIRGDNRLGTVILFVVTPVAFIL